MSLKKQLFLGCALGALAAVSPALAKPPPPPVPPPVPVFTWTGWYVGGNIGYSWGSGPATFIDNALGSWGLPTSFTSPAALNGVVGGPEIGYDFQVSPNSVVGLVADFQWADEKNRSPFYMGYNCEGVCSIAGTVGSRIHWFGTLRANAGWLVTPTTLVYVTGGLAYGEVSVNGSLTNFNNLQTCCGSGPAAPLPGSFSFGGSAINAGGTVGAGIRGVVPNTSLVWKVEYLYVDLGSLSGSSYDPIFGGAVTWNARFTDNILRFGLDYYFH